VLDGAGAVGAGTHARHEYVELGEMPGRAALAAGLLAALTDRGQDRALTP
jgi:glutamate carboxypeptidase